MKKILIILGLVISLNFTAVLSVDAKSVSWNDTITEDLYYYWDHDGNMIGGGYALGLVNPNVTVSYHAEVENCDTGEKLSDGAVVPVGTRLKFTPVPHQDTDIYWFGTGYSSDSPYGHWVGEAGVPATMSFLPNDYVGKYFHEVQIPILIIFELDVYVPLNISPPEIMTSQTGTAGLETPDTDNCQAVLTAGTIEPQFQFGDTYGKFYYRYKGRVAEPPTGIQQLNWAQFNVPMSLLTNNKVVYTEYGNKKWWFSDPDEPPYILQVPAQTISFNLEAVGGDNNPPNPPVITGEQNLGTGQVEPYSFVATDPDGDDISYQIDWENIGSYSQQLPATGFVTSSTSQSQTYSWNTLGNHTFKARTKDSQGLFSDWTTYTVTVADSVTISACSASPNPADVGTSVTWAASVSGGTAPYSYTWSDHNGVISHNDSATLSYGTAGTKAVTLIVTDDNGATDTRTCSVLTVNDPVAPPVTGSGVDISADKIFARPGDEVTITWDLGGNDPATCIIGPNLTTDLSTQTGEVPVNFYGTTEYYLNCPSGSDSVTVRLIPIYQET